MYWVHLPVLGEIEGEEGEPSSSPECPVCLQPCIHPVKLPCLHVFCFLCVKGAANQSKRCALCRRLIPINFFNEPTLIRKEDLVREMNVEDGYLWFYEGTNGWWQYDERTSKEIEERYKTGQKSFDLLIAGFLYIIDVENMLQVRRNDTTRRRRIKRDAANTPKKGVAGLKMILNESQDREGAYGSSSSPAETKTRKLPQIPVTDSSTSQNSNNPTPVHSDASSGVSDNTDRDDSLMRGMHSQLAALSLEPGTRPRRRRPPPPPSNRHEESSAASSQSHSSK